MNNKERLDSAMIVVTMDGQTLLVEAHLDAWKDNQKFINEYKALTPEEKIKLLTGELFAAGCSMGDSTKL